MNCKIFRNMGTLVPLFILAACAVQVTPIGLRPLYPEYPERYRWHYGNPYDKLIMEVDSLQPTLKWESFPRSQYLQAGGNPPSRIRNVTYELQILGTESESVYERKGLPAPYHRVAPPLLPSTRYCWSVRARFDVDGQPRVTEWGKMTVVIEDIAHNAPRSLLYSFRTPEAK